MSRTLGQLGAWLAAEWAEDSTFESGYEAAFEWLEDELSRE